MLLKMAAFFCTGGSRNLDLFILYFLLSLCWNLYSLSYDQNNLEKLEGRHLFFVLLNATACDTIMIRHILHTILL